MFQHYNHKQKVTFVEAAI